MHALLLTVLCAGANAAPQGNKVLAAEQRFVDLSNRIEVEHDRAAKAFLAAGSPQALFQAQTDLESLSREVQSAEIAVALEKDELTALATAQVEYFEIGARLAAYRELVGSRMDDLPAVQAGLKKLFAADAQASILKADILDAYAGTQPFAVVVSADAAGELGLRVLISKGMPIAAVETGIRKSQAKRALPVIVYDLPDFEP